MARSEAFTLDQIVTVSSAYTRVSGREHADGSASILVTAVVEGLNLLEVVAARRIVAQVSISFPNDGGPLRISLAGSRFEGLQLAGVDCRPMLNPGLVQPQSGGRARDLRWPDIDQVGRAQADSLIQGFQGRNDGAYEWAQKRHEWRTRDPQCGTVLCSLVDGFEDADSATSCGHVVEIPGFGRIILGELRLSGDSVQLVAIRAELGCPVKGKVSISCVGGGGSGDY
jgi:hypothetical protein